MVGVERFGEELDGRLGRAEDDPAAAES